MNAVNAASRRPAMEYVGIDVHKNQSQTGVGGSGRSLDAKVLTHASYTKGKHYGYRYTNSTVPVGDNSETGCRFLLRPVVPLGMAHVPLDSGGCKGTSDPGDLEVPAPRRAQRSRSLRP